MKLRELQQLVQHVEAQRNKRMPVWQELSRFMAPHRGVFPGEERENLRNRHQFNNVAARALRKSAAGMTEGMTPANLPWFRHDYIDRDQREISGSREYADAVDERLNAILAAGGFYQAIHSFNLELLCFGCALLYEEQSMQTVAHFECPTVGTYAVSTDGNGMLDFVSHRLQFTARELERKFGRAALSTKVQASLETRPYEEVEVVHVVMKRGGVDKRKIDRRSKPWASFWYEADNAEHLLDEGGYDEMPYFFTVWQDARGRYGVGPGDEALADQKSIETYEMYKSMGLEKTLDPPLIMPGTLKGRVDTRPGGKNTGGLTAAGSQIIPLYQIDFGHSLPYVQQEIQTVSARIEDSLMASVFASISMDQRPAQMSATEFMARKREATQQMGPAMSAYEPKVLNRVLERTYAIADRLGFMPDPPPDLGQQFVLDVDYLGPMAQSLRQTGSDTTRQLVSDVLPLAQANPDVLDKLDLDQVVDELARGIAAPGSVVRSDSDVEDIRKARAEQQAQMQQQQMAMAQQQQMIDAAKIPTEGTLGGEMMGGGM